MDVAAGRTPRRGTDTCPESNRIREQSRTKPRKLTSYGITATDQSIGEMSRTTRARSSSASNLLTVFDGGPAAFGDYTLGKPGAVRRLATRTGCTSAPAPAADCLRASGNAWHLTWRLPWQTMCTEHGTLMVATCPACRLPFNAGSRRDGTSDRAPATCPPRRQMREPLDTEHRTPTRHCAATLRGHPHDRLHSTGSRRHQTRSTRSWPLGTATRITSGGKTSAPSPRHCSATATPP